MWKIVVIALALAGLSGCAALNTIESDVSTSSHWPAKRRPGTFTFERLPSQEARAEEQARLEELALPALQAAGFTQVQDPAAADMTVQIGVHSSRAQSSPFDDPLWWRGGIYYSRLGRPAFFHGPGLMYQFDSPRYQREVAVLVRDRDSAQPLYEARAANDGNTPGGDELFSAMFQAALKDFPHAGVNPRQVSVRLK